MRSANRTSLFFLLKIYDKIYIEKMRKELINMSYIIIVIVFSILIFSLLCVVWFMGWSFSKDGLKIKFKQFISMYEIAPEKWRLYEDGTVAYKKTEYSLQCFYFSPTDYLRYFVFLKGRHKRKIEQQWLEIAKLWQNDIGKFQEDYVKELQNKIKEF